VYPEEIEAVINTHPSVQMSLAKSRRNPITGAMVTADVLLADRVLGCEARPSDSELAERILEHCRQSLPAWKVPATIRIVASLEVTAAGKLKRSNP
jgi:acyl-coenzyme A synthetase/AMP-(fatty) acid ligase